MKKKLIAMALAASMVASLSACGSKPAEAPAETEAKTETEAKAETEAKEETEAKAEESAESSGDVKSVEGLNVAFVPKLTGNAFFESAKESGRPLYGMDAFVLRQASRGFFHRQHPRSFQPDRRKYPNTASTRQKKRGKPLSGQKYFNENIKERIVYSL